MTIEELINACTKAAEAWSEIRRQLKEVADAIYETFNTVFGNPDLWHEKDGTPLKKYGMSLRKRCQRGTGMHYNYIPKSVRNQPYQSAISTILHDSLQSSCAVPYLGFVSLAQRRLRRMGGQL